MKLNPASRTPKRSSKKPEKNDQDPRLIRAIVVGLLESKRPAMKVSIVELASAIGWSDKTYRNYVTDAKQLGFIT